MVSYNNSNIAFGSSKANVDDNMSFKLSTDAIQADTYQTDLIFNVEEEEDFFTHTASNQQFPIVDQEETFNSTGNINITLGCDDLTKTKFYPIECQQQEIAVTPWDRSMAELYAICDCAQVPRYLCDQILDKIKEEQNTCGFDPSHPGITTRNPFMARLKAKTNISPPKAVFVTLASGIKVSVFQFPFLESLQEHLISSIFADKTNLAFEDQINQQDPWSLLPQEKPLYKITSGRWYKNTYSKYLKELGDNHLYF